MLYPRDVVHLIVIALVCYDGERHALHGAIGVAHYHGIGGVFSALICDVAVSLDNTSDIQAAINCLIKKKLCNLS